MQREKPPEWREKQKGSRGIRRGQRYRLVFQFPIRQADQNDGKIYTNVPVISTLPAPGIPSLIYHFRRWLLQFVQEHLRSFSY